MHPFVSSSGLVEKIHTHTAHLWNALRNDRAICLGKYVSVVPESTMVPFPDWNELVLPIEWVPTLTSCTITLNQLPLYLDKRQGGRKRI